MRVLVQQLKTDLFLDETGRWIEQADGAQQFTSSADALIYCVREAIHDVRIGVLFGEPEFDVYFYPFQTEARKRTEALSARNAALKSKQINLLNEVKAAVAEIANQTKKLPLRRKKKRKFQPERE